VAREVLIETDLVAELIPEWIAAKLCNRLVSELDLEGLRQRRPKASIGNKGIRAIFSGCRRWFFAVEECTLVQHKFFSRASFLGQRSSSIGRFFMQAISDREIVARHYGKAE
jgi:hypothetical protein